MGMIERKKRLMMMQTIPGILPAGYQQVEYIASDGYAYINSGVYGNQDSGVVLDFKIDVIADVTMFGARTGPSSNAFYILIRGGAYFSSSYDGSGNTDFIDNGGGKIAADTNRHKIIIDKQARNFDDISQDTIGSYVEFTTPNELYLFRSHHQSDGAKMAEMRIYSCIINNNGTPVRNFVPCYRKRDNEIGMYDIVNGIFYANGNSQGSFSKGSDI